MAYSSCILRKSVPWVAILVMFSVFAAFSGHGVSSITITSFILTFSTIFLTFAKQKAVTLEEPEPAVHQEIHILHSHGSTKQQESLSLSTDEQPKIEAISQERPTQNGAGGGQIQGYMVRSQDLYSESESNDQSSSSEDSDIDWSCSGNLGQSPECSDDSISDEESLIEIALPSGHYVGCPKDEDPKFFKHHKLPDFSSETVFHHQPSIMELLAEFNDMNEEDNLIEIDLSMGSIKCTRFEIQT